MFYVAVMPVPVYVVALGAVALLLLRTLFMRHAARPLLVKVTTWITLAAIGLAFAALYFTWDYSISPRACLTGLFGVLGAQPVIGVQLIALIWAMVVKWHVTMGWLRAHKGHAALIVAGQVIATLVLARSAALCTV